MPAWEKRAILVAMLKFRNNKPATERNANCLEMSGSSVKSKKMIGQLEIASGEGKSTPVICEWINYDIHTSDQVPDRLLNRVAAIAQQFSIHPLPAEFNVLYCEGYIHDLDHLRSGLLFSYPENVVGLLLLEIGLWEPISRSPLLGDKGIEKWRPGDLQRLWLEKAVPLLGPIMGTKYRDAGLDCDEYQSMVRYSGGDVAMAIPALLTIKSACFEL
ncbi:hypothetical protein N431DRAFT_450134 [Stipitochalara longipes BDJ]|nr:hypothetical protein N431DRAFT_450134 [Stipitochalara longipes BDJ]